MHKQQVSAKDDLYLYDELKIIHLMNRESFNALRLLLIESAAKDA